MTVNSKKGILVILVICIVLALSALIYLKVNSGNQPAESGQQSEQENNVTPVNAENKTETPNAEGAKPAETKPETVRTQPTKEAYEKVLEDYKRSGYRIQLSNCSGIPGKMNIKQGTKFMVDNRDATKHTVKLASVSRTVEAYDYEIFVAPKYGTYNLTCDGKGSAELNVYP